VLRQALGAFGDVSPVSLGPDSFSAAAPDRLTAAYRPLLDLCRLLADCLAPGPTAGGTPCPAFLIDMERVFERYVTNGIVRAFPEGGRYRVSVQPCHVANRLVAGQPDIQMRPDLTLNEAGRPVVIVDAKWKRLPPEGLLTDDLYQVLAYCTALDVSRAALIYPGRRNRVWHYALARSPISLEIHTLRVHGRRELCDRALTTLGRALRPGRSV
jgi:5-methylcytosine-specific restriction enzyme subunit McrC